MARGNPCGDCARHRRSRATVLVIRLSSTTSFTVSLSGIAATAPTPERALSRTPSMVSRVTKGRAPSWMRTVPTCSGKARNPARTEWARVAPPATSASRSPTSFASQSGGRFAKPAGRATTTWPMSGCDVKGRNARNSMGTPRMGRNCFGSPGPARAPAPAATITTPTSGGEAPGEVTDAVHRDHVETGQGHARAGREEDATETLARRLAQSPLETRDRTNLPAQAHLPEEHGVRRQRPVVHARHQRRQHGEVGRRLDQPGPARHVDEHVEGPEGQPAAALEHREQHRQSTVVEPRRHALRRAEATLGGE